MYLSVDSWCYSQETEGVWRMSTPILTAPSWPPSPTPSTRWPGPWSLSSTTSPPTPPPTSSASPGLLSLATLASPCCTRYCLRLAQLRTQDSMPGLLSLLVSVRLVPQHLLICHLPTFLWGEIVYHEHLVMFSSYISQNISLDWILKLTWQSSELCPVRESGRMEN